jgi:hypothetical protein
MIAAVVALVNPIPFRPCPLRKRDLHDHDHGGRCACASIQCGGHDPTGQLAHTAETIPIRFNQGQSIDTLHVRTQRLQRPVSAGHRVRRSDDRISDNGDIRDARFDHVAAMTQSVAAVCEAIKVGNYYPAPHPMNCTTSQFRSRCPVFGGK